MNNKKHRLIREIAIEISCKWKNINPAAKPYLVAMISLETIDDRFICDTAEDIILRFLSNASTWRGEDARRIKAELNAMLK